MDEKDAREPTPFDEMMKRLADAYGRELVAYFGGLEGLEECEPVGGEIEMTHRVTDRIFRIKLRRQGQAEEGLVHLEFESSYNPRMGRRLGMYGWGLYEKSSLPVRHLVWYVSEEAPSYWVAGTWKRERKEEMVFGGHTQAWVRWEEFWLPGGYQAADFVEEAPVYLLPFAALMKGEKKPLCSRLAEAIMESDAAPDRKQDLLVMAAFFLARERSLSLPEILEAFKMTWLEQNPLIDYIKQQNLQKGREEGLEEGLEKGREEQRKAIALRLLELSLPLEQIAAATGLSQDEISSLRSDFLEGAALQTTRKGCVTP